MAGSPVDDAALVHLRNFPRLRKIDLSRTLVQGPGLVHLREHDRLDEVVLDQTAITANSLEYLVGLDTVSVISLEHTELQPADVDSLWNLKNLRAVLVGSQVVCRPKTPDAEAPTTSTAAPVGH